MSRSCCPDCNRWRCVCLAMEESDGGGVPLPGGLVVVHDEVTHWPRARWAPCPADVRARLQALRAEFAARAGHR